MIVDRLFFQNNYHHFVHEKFNRSHSNVQSWISNQFDHVTKKEGQNFYVNKPHNYSKFVEITSTPVPMSTFRT